jgi:hypothetical protein
MIINFTVNYKQIIFYNNISIYCIFELQMALNTSLDCILNWKGIISAFNKCYSIGTLLFMHYLFLDKWDIATLQLQYQTLNVIVKWFQNNFNVKDFINKF